MAARSAGRHERSQRGRGRRRQAFALPPMPARIDVLSADQESGAVHVQLTGPLRPPHARLFVLTDSRGRRFIPTQAECYAVDDPPPVSPDAPAVLPHWRCAMNIPTVYRRSPLTGVSMEWGDRIVSALPGQVKALGDRRSGLDSRRGPARSPPRPMPQRKPRDPLDSATPPVQPDPSADPAAAAPTPVELEPIDPAPPNQKIPGPNSEVGRDRPPGKASFPPSLPRDIMAACLSLCPAERSHPRPLSPSEPSTM